jgi:prenyltransferase beta subunit
VSLRLEMLQVARLAPKLLADSAELVGDFIVGQRHSDGGFRDRKGESDLYYTAFGLDCLHALQRDVPREKTAKYLESFGTGTELDFVHLCCLARCWAAVGGRDDCVTQERADAILIRLEKFRSHHGGFNPIPGSAHGTAYAAFLGLGAHQDLRVDIPNPLGLVQSLKFLETPDGGWANERGIPAGATNATAACISVLRNLRMPINPAVGEWLMAQFHPDGGFRAVPGAPLPDLLSTATALHALAGLEHDISSVKEPCLDFIDSLWTNEGSFYGHWGEDILDCEYTFYGLLALGHLSL